MSPDPLPLSNELLEALGLLVQVFQEKGTDYALIGGLAVAVHGPLRATRDIDLMVRAAQIELPRVLEALADRGFQLDVINAIAEWNRHHLLLFSFAHVQVDWVKAVLPPFQRVLDRASWKDFAGRRVRVADAEGMLLLKLIAFRPRDQEDIRGILAANPGVLDLDWVRRQWEELTTPDDPRTAQFEEMVREFYQDGR